MEANSAEYTLTSWRGKRRSVNRYNPRSDSQDFARPSAMCWSPPLPGFSAYTVFRNHKNITAYSGVSPPRMSFLAQSRSIPRAEHSSDKGLHPSSKRTIGSWGRLVLDTHRARAAGLRAIVATTSEASIPYFSIGRKILAWGTPNNAAHCATVRVAPSTVAVTLFLRLFARSPQVAHLQLSFVYPFSLSRRSSVWCLLGRSPISHTNLAKDCRLSEPFHSGQTVIPLPP